jgi:hypothetical protein
MSAAASNNTERTTTAFPLGQLVATRAVIEHLGGRQAAFAYVARHQANDWGEVSESDAEANASALAEGDRILSAYTSPKGERIYVITEADRSATTIMLAEEY